MSVVNDVHSRLNETEVNAVAPVDSLESIGATLDLARSSRRPISIAGGRHAMGGQQFCAGGIVLDTRPLSRVLSLDEERGLVEVEAGIQWPALVDALARHALGDPPEADRRGRPLHRRRRLGERAWARARRTRPFVADVESLVVVGAGRRRSPVLARGERRTLPPRLRRLRPLRRRLLRHAAARPAPQARARRAPRARERARGALRRADRDGYLYGDFQFEIDPASPGFLQHGDLLLLPARPRRHAARRRHEALGRGLEPAPPPRPLRQDARLRDVRRALPRDLRARSTSPIGTSSAYVDATSRLDATGPARAR